ncbi:MAG: hypothetical protein A2X52_00515 [Candidatus Rokubacteria bacterium GWC2_70_16]|nr:MAG: hypothetical protein A2X52_00515 [Candidatus Rokubacteria bacterium GWC2_70_16]
MEILQSLAAGFAVILTPANLYYCFIGSLVGTLVGVLPGIGPLAALSLLLPFTFTLPPVASLVMLSAIFYGAMYGGSMPAGAATWSATAARRPQIRPSTRPAPARPAVAPRPPGAPGPGRR